MPSRRAHSRANGFTLVELLTVITIIGVLLAVGAGMMSSSPAQARKAGIDTLQSIVEQARTRAITKRVHVALAFVDPGDAPGGDPRRQRIGMFEIADWSEEAIPTLTTLEVRQVGRWQSFEQGVILIDGSGSVTLPNPLDGERMTLRLGSDEAAGEIEARVMVFHPRGGLRLPAGSEPVVLRLAEGTFRNGEAVPSTRDGVVRESTLRVGRVIARPYRND